MVDRYEIRDDYRPNTANLTREIGTVAYWTTKQIRRSALYQWPVYALGRQIIRERGIDFVVDVGCGPAIKLNRLLVPCVKRAVGIDQESAIQFCRSQYAHGEYIIDDLENPIVDWDQEPDLVICADVIEHVEDPDVLLRYLYDLGGEDTIYVISTPDRVRLRGAQCVTCPNPAHIREWAADEFCRYLAKRGLAIEQSKFLPPLRQVPHPLVLWHYVRQRARGCAWRYNLACVCRKVKRTSL